MLFSYLPPQSDSAVHDPGAGGACSEIKREGNLYHYSIDTRLMHGGLGWWYFVSEDPDPQKRRAKVGKFIVQDVPRALLERSPIAVPVKQEGEDVSGFDMLGMLETETQETNSSTRVIIGIGLAIGTTLLLL